MGLGMSFETVPFDELLLLDELLCPCAGRPVKGRVNARHRPKAAA